MYQRAALPRRRSRFRKVCFCSTSSQLAVGKRLLEDARTCLEGPFGELIRATGPMATGDPLRFSTKYQDNETDLLYYGYRYYNLSTGSWISSDPGAQVTSASNPQATPNGDETNVYLFADGDPQNHWDFLGLEAFQALSEGYAFRDPWYGSFWGASQSRLRSSTDAYYFGWAVPFLSSICNSGDLGVAGGDRNPVFVTSYVRAWLINTPCARGPVTYRVTCHATLTASMFDRVSRTAGFNTVGEMLGEKIRPDETKNSSPRKGTYSASFTKSVSKVIVVDSQYKLYELYMPVSGHVTPHKGGFVEQGEADCSVAKLSSN